MTDAHEYKYMVDNGVIADPLMKAWQDFETKIFDRMFQPTRSSVNPITVSSLQKVKAINDKYTTVRRTMYELLDQLNDPMFFTEPTKDVNQVERIIATFMPHVGKTITYTPDKDLPESQRSYSKFVIKKEVLEYLHYYDLSAVKKELKATDDTWVPIDDIYWGQGYHSELYGNANGVMFVKNGNGREYVGFDEPST